jgi:hypothetical protein
MTDPVDIKVKLTSGIQPYVCSKNFTSATLTATTVTGTAASYNWQINGNPITNLNSNPAVFIATAPGKYTVTATNGNGDQSSDRLDFEVYQSPGLATEITYIPNCVTEVLGTVVNFQAGHSYFISVVSGAYSANLTVTSSNQFVLPITGPGTYNISVTDNTCPNCNDEKQITVGPNVMARTLGSPFTLTQLNPNPGGAPKPMEFKGIYLVNGPLELVNGEFTLQPGTRFYVEPANGVDPRTMGFYTFPPYLTQNGGATYPTIIKVGTGGKLNLKGALLTSVCNTSQKWGGIHLTSDAEISSQLNPDTHAPTVISKAYVGVGLSKVTGGSPAVNTNRYYISGTDFEDNQYGVWDYKKLSPALLNEGITGCNFNVNETGVFLDNEQIPGWTGGGNYAAAIFRDNTFTTNRTGLIGYANNLTLSANAFTGHDIGAIILSANAGTPAVVTGNTISVPDYATGMAISGSVMALNNPVNGTANRLATGIKPGANCTITGNTLTDLKDGIEINTDLYTGILIDKNIFTDNLTGIRFPSYPSYHNTGGMTPPVITCNTFSAVGITNGATTRGIHIEQYVRLVYINATPNNMNRLGSSGAPNGNLFTTISEPVRNDGVTPFQYYVYKNSSQELKQPDLIGGSINSMSTILGAGACGGGTNPGVNSRMSNPNAASINNSKTEIYLGSCFPNPAQSETIIPVNLPENYQFASIVIREVISGKLIQTFELQPKQKKQSYVLSLDTFQAGLYAYTLVVDSKTIATKLLKVGK